MALCGADTVLTREGFGDVQQEDRRSRAKVKALAKRAGTPGEQAAAEAALVRMGEPRCRPGHRPPPALTDAIVRRLPHPRAATTSPGTMTCRASAFASPLPAARSFVFNYRVKGTGQERRITIGGFPNWSTGAARNEAKRLRRLVDSGADPRGEFEDSARPRLWPI